MRWPKPRASRHPFVRRPCHDPCEVGSTARGRAWEGWRRLMCPHPCGAAVRARHPRALKAAWRRIARRRPQRGPGRRRTRSGPCSAAACGRTRGRPRSRSGGWPQAGDMRPWSRRCRRRPCRRPCGACPRSGPWAGAVLGSEEEHAGIVGEVAVPVAHGVSPPNRWPSHSGYATNAAPAHVRSARCRSPRWRGRCQARLSPPRARPGAPPRKEWSEDPAGVVERSQQLPDWPAATSSKRSSDTVQALSSRLPKRPMALGVFQNSSVNRLLSA